ncbi:DUF2062 domain-containing protein [Nitrosococcus oceani]|uniref:DUF2062 domain-containing protein n=2 Tax=Nitrosococcus oceani TaxID=1229 RepID=Q3J7S2_NITOC|nr:DUF2062 domain-containing protein [Nitrosococcus oceani]KFI18446.1 ATP-binding protein [Nitrosococcus oceani C-27]ABA59124.1 conserved hypothetical protein [Nitrosococcus oceani ATCC 19707]EDZ65827.1 hypothetical protein NOC27_2507 [Nitrosococcus oceani AFC27]KFI21682.1 ATP-binding protein [Nitrosococcus oceani]GEM20346.1 ATP-binding protein [Nitrosococcus oceani]
MPRRIIKRYIPQPHQLQEHKHLRHLGEWFFASDLWHLSRRSTAGAVGVGLFIAFLPLPGQMLIAAVAAAWARVNLPVAILMVWVTNPLTMGPMFFFAYKVGTWLLGSPVYGPEFEFTWQQWLQTRLAATWEPFLLGCLVVGVVVGLTGGLLTLVLWRLEVSRRWRNRKRRKVISQMEK